MRGLIRELGVTEDACQRWGHGRVHAWRYARLGGFRKERYEVGPVNHRIARDWTIARHYSGSWPQVRLTYGLYDLWPHLADEEHGPEPDVLDLGMPRLVGVAALSVPQHEKVLPKTFAKLVPNEESLELGRFVVGPSVAGNGESEQSCAVRTI
ncbi:hypothetical protein [Nonomuraea sp. NPDC050202]|uniref:hypothetical protein n=1 Tax=Nonomuraea sp. NPDC050202 TaxID=3155035 RepID=UPI0033F3E812